MTLPRHELIESLADEMIANEPQLLSAEDRTHLIEYLDWKCRAYLLDRDNDIRVETANALIRKRERKIPWTPADEEAAARYGVRR